MRGTYGTGLALVTALIAASFCVAGVALTALGWLWWRPWSPLVPCDAAPLLHGRCGAWRHLHLFCVAGGAWRHLPSFLCSRLALTALDWLWWRPWWLLVPVMPRLFAWQAWHLATSAFVLCGGTGMALVAALVAAGPL
eukprot:s619_g15.t1